MTTSLSKPESASARLPKPDQGKKSRALWVYDQLRRAIQTGELSTGERIREEQIAQWLGVSRTPVREALSKLESAGLLESVASGLIIVELSRSQVNELYALREVLEGAAARFAAQHAAVSEILTMRQLMSVFEQSLDDPIRLAEINRAVHTAIYEASHNSYLIKSLNELQDTLALLQRTTFEMPDRPKLALAEHTLIIDAIERRDADEAERVSRHHIRNAQLSRLSMMYASIQAR